MELPVSVIVAMMRSRIVRMVVLAIVPIMAVGAMAEFRFYGGVGDAMLGGKPLLDGPDRFVGIDAIVEASMQGRHVA